MKYRPDGSTCWLPWREWDLCWARNSAENLRNPVTYPITPYPPGYKQMMSLPLPPDKCAYVSERPANIGYQFQFQLTVTGSCRLRGLFFHAEDVEKQLYQNLVKC
jgi:hypothetical protein